MRIRNLCRGGWASNCYLVSQGTDAVVIVPTLSLNSGTALGERLHIRFESGSLHLFDRETEKSFF